MGLGMARQARWLSQRKATRSWGARIQWPSRTPRKYTSSASPREVYEPAPGEARGAVGRELVGLDPSRGALLTMLVQRPTVMERIEKGEAVGYLIIGPASTSVVDALYMTFITIATIGYAEVVDVSNSVPGRLFTVFIGAAGIGDVEMGVADRDAEGEAREVRALQARAQHADEQAGEHACGQVFFVKVNGHCWRA